MSQTCLTDYITIDNLQIIFDETSQQDGVALRLWSPFHAKNEENGWVTDWHNACHFHMLMRFYPSGRDLCYQYFEKKAEEILQGNFIDWHQSKCPTSLYIFGWPIYGSNGEVLAILFGGLVRDKSGVIAGDEWNKVKKALAKDRALIPELENEFNYVPEFSHKRLQELFSKWKLFCKLLSKLLISEDPTPSDSDYWIERLTNFHSCSTIACNLASEQTRKSAGFNLNIIENTAHYSHYIYYKLLITQEVCLAEFESSFESQKRQYLYSIPVSKTGTTELAIDDDAFDQKDGSVFWDVSKKIVSAILLNSYGKDLHHRKVLLERQSKIFEETSKHSVTDLGVMIKTLFDQLRITGVIKIDFASFSEVVYFPKNQSESKPNFKARVVYPEERWTKSQRKVIEDLDLYTNKPLSTGSTVCAFQKARPVLDRNVTNSPTYVSTQPNVSSSLVIPIKYGPLLLGVISFDSIEKNYFTDQRKRQLENLTQLISPIVYHKNFQEVLHELNENVKQLAQRLKPKSRQKIREHILMALSRLIQAEVASFWEEGEKEGVLYRGTSIGRIAHWSQEVKINKSLIGDLFLGKRDHVLVKNLEGDNGDALLYRKQLVSQGVSSYLAFPVSIGGKRVIISFYRRKCAELFNRDFSEVELDITQKLGEILSFYETLNDIFESQRSELEIQISSREELAITLAHNIKSPLSANFARLDDLKRKVKANVGGSNYSTEYLSLFSALDSSFFAIRRSTNSVLRQLSLQEQYEAGFVGAQAFHLYYDILTRQIARVRRGLNIYGESHRRIVDLSGHKQFPLLYGDKISIEDMISNLLENAVKYSNKADKLFVETYFDYAAAELHLYVKNEGEVHIPKNDIERIFEYAYRSKPARDKDPSSTGVGLYYSRYIAEKHGGKLSLVKTANPVTFKLTLPVKLLSSAKSAEEVLSEKSNN